MASVVPPKLSGEEQNSRQLDSIEKPESWMVQAVFTEVPNLL